MTVAAQAPISREHRIKRMAYRSWHRGCKETDIILGHFADNHLPQLNDEALDIFEDFLEEQDADIWKWLTGELTPPSTKYDTLLKQLMQYSDLTKLG